MDSKIYVILKEIENITRLDLWDAIVEHGIATEEEIELVTAINGFNDNALNDIIYVRTGYKNIEDFLEDKEEIISIKEL